MVLYHLQFLLHLKLVLSFGVHGVIEGNILKGEGLEASGDIKDLLPISVYPYQKSLNDFYSNVL
jgi:hypothetical protein